jgi:Spy/CpxP family protein refolding chaperone
MSAYTKDRLEKSAKPSRGYIVWPIAFILLALAVSVAASAWGGHGGMRGHGMFGRHHGGPPDAEAVRERVAFGLEWGLRKLDATPEQEQQIQVIAADAVDRMIALHEGRAESKETLRALVTAEQVDRAALEAWRAQQIATFDRASQQLADSVASALDVLTPEQRAQLAEEMARHHH